MDWMKKIEEATARHFVNHFQMPARVVIPQKAYTDLFGDSSASIESKDGDVLIEAGPEGNDIVLYPRRSLQSM